MNWTPRDTTQLIAEVHSYVSAQVIAQQLRGKQVSMREVARALFAIGMVYSDEATQSGEPGTSGHCLASYMVEACGRSREVAHALVDDCFDRADLVLRKPRRAV